MLNWFISSFKAYRRCLKSLITPHEIVETLHAIDFDDLYKNGYRTIFFDVDNTLVAPEKVKLSLQMENMVNAIKNKGFSIFLVSNNSSKNRIQRICHQLDVTGYFFAIKPFPFTAFNIRTHYNINFEKTIVIGDQLLTDIVLSNWINAYGIFVEPINKKLSFIKTLQRELELKLIHWLS
jgi:HAD superfamily phosphatase (TIGR01668 family)